MPKPVYLLTVQEAHKEYNSLTDQISAKYKQLDSDNAEACELANLLACVSHFVIVKRKRNKQISKYQISNFARN